MGLIRMTILMVLLIFLSGCANTQGNAMVDTATLPKQCGEYYMHYGVPEGYKRDDGTVGEPITLNGNNITHMNPKYIGKEVALFTWIQVVGGLPLPDGSGGYAITYYNVVKEVLLRGEYNLLNHDAIDDACHELKHRE